jgi:ABC-2 type transport system permease protein
LLRIRQPKYLVGALFGIAYLYFVFFRRYPQRPGGRPATPLDDIATAGAPMILIIGSISLLVFVALCWALRRQRAALSFTEAEIAFLFPAPVGRPALIHYRLISAALASLFTALILGFFSRRWSGVSPDGWIRFVGWWVIFSTVSLHTIGSAFVITRWQDRGISPLGCQLIAWGVIAVLFGVPILWLWQQAHAGIELGADVFEHGPVAWLVYPFRLLLAPVLAANASAFLNALWPALLLYAAHYWWVLRVQVGFEEASIARAERRTRKLEAIRAGNWRLGEDKQKARPGPFNLARAGRPEFAFLWKNLLSTREYLRLRNLLIAAAIIVAAGIWFADSGFVQAVGVPLASVLLMFSAYALVLGPQLARQDFRSDIANTDILKTYPLRGWQIMLGEILTPAAILTGIIWLMLLAGAMLIPDELPPRMAWLTGTVRGGAGIGIALLVPLLCTAQLLIANAAAVLFPAWSLTAANRGPQGIEVMGQRILFMVIQMLSLALMLVPIAIGSALAFFVLRWIIGDVIAAGAALVVAMGVLAAEIAAGLWLLGDRFEKLDLSQELRP